MFLSLANAHRKPQRTHSSGANTNQSSRCSLICHKVCQLIRKPLLSSARSCSSFGRRGLQQWTARQSKHVLRSCNRPMLQILEIYMYTKASSSDVCNVRACCSLYLSLSLSISLPLSLSLSLSLSLARFVQLRMPAGCGSKAGE